MIAQRLSESRGCLQMDSLSLRAAWKQKYLIRLFSTLLLFLHIKIPKDPCEKASFSADLHAQLSPACMLVTLKLKPGSRTSLNFDSARRARPTVANAEV